MNQEVQDLENSVVAEVKESTRITPEATDEVRQLVLRISEPSFRCAKGQSIAVVVPGPHEFGNKYHIRRYSIANDPASDNGEGVDLSILVRRCFYIDEFSGEQYPGIASNYLCDARPGDRITITGPYRSPFNVPSDPESNLLMIATGTGIAPFRAFLQYIYRQKGAWKGKVRLYCGARSGMDLLYMNDKNDDLANYYDEETFKVYNALTNRPVTGESAVNRSVAENAAQAWDLIQEPNTYVFVAGLDKIAPALDRAMSSAAGSEEAWNQTKQRMMEAKRWSELLYA